MFHLKFNFFHIGDQIATTAIPENLFNITGKRSVISDPRIWAFKHNPYVEFMSEQEASQYPTVSLIPDCRVPEMVQAYEKMMLIPVSNGQTEYMCVNMGFNDVRLRHSRLYVYEDVRPRPDRVVVHTTGSDRTRDSEPAIRRSSGEDEVRVMSDDVIESIRENYRGWDVYQVGADTDKSLGFGQDLRGRLDYWQVAELIAGSSRFIGVNSGPMHIANCYPRVDKRIVLMEFPVTTLVSYRPGDTRNWLFSWIDPASTFFNRFEQDAGFTYSHTKI